jgi:hypothetical protein
MDCEKCGLKILAIMTDSRPPLLHEQPHSGHVEQ